MPPEDPCALLEQLDPAAIRHRIAELDRERAALVVLLRAADARKRVARHGRVGGEEAPNVS
jgi:hypothetical protein